MCKGLRENSQDVRDYMFNVNVRINRLKGEGTEDVNEVGKNNQNEQTKNGKLQCGTTKGHFCPLFPKCWFV